ncbi:carboxymuconolactone decarboxylase family protein [Streptomyces sp. NA02950]|uniref:carboxymuconolactone decarboxylase family protein n=1 Tax=Streptomyces sp. NA02950 TaxID=2742137 RepID=UPI0015915D1B|nr:carboxymuconolactone decarboxylase family protein [Streptomyces sp. NA02950]QKV97859.1 carboxymuconolactone decarboxylase family protein [Streptomyces sp. NA02950]
MEATVQRLGHLSPAVARLAESPQLLDGFLKLSGAFETTTLDPLAREVLILTIAVRNACHLCVEMHTATIRALGADGALIDALRAAQPLEDGRLDAVRVFALDALATTGALSPGALDAFLAQGYTRRNALEVVLGIGAYTLSTFANRMTQAPLHGHLAPAPAQEGPAAG